MNPTNLPRHTFRATCLDPLRVSLVVAVLVSPGLVGGCRRAPSEVSQALLLRVNEALIELSPNGPVTLYPVSVGGDERAAIFAPAPSRIRFRDVVVPDQANLSFGVGLIDSSDWRDGKADGALFALEVAESPGQAKTIWSQRLAPADGNAGSWTEAEVDLSEYAGRSVDLLFKTSQLEGKVGRAAWSSPVLWGLRSSTPTVRGPIPRWHVELDLMEGFAPPISMNTFSFFRPGRILQAHAGRIMVSQTKNEPPQDPSSDRLDFRFRVPERGALELGGEVLVGPESSDSTLGPVTFIVEIEGKPVLRREFGTPGHMVSWGGVEDLDISRYNGLSFVQTVPLDEHAGKTVDVTLRLDATRSDDVYWWTGLLLKRSELIERRGADRGPNVLVMLVDTLRADHLGLYGYERPVSPNLDRFGEQSLVFDRAFSQAPWTQPSVASLMTGLEPLEHGVIGGVTLHHSFDTNAIILQDAGFTTVAISSNPIITRRAGFHVGFEEFLEIPEGRAEEMIDLFDHWLAENENLQWFAYLHFLDPHGPFDAPEPFGSRFLPEVEQKESPQGDPDVENMRARYDGEIQYLDKEFGRLLAILEQREVLDDTIIIFVADHGEEFNEHGKLFHSEQIYNETVHVPLLLWAPGLVEPGRAPGTVEVRDILETVLEMLNVRPSSSGETRLTAARKGSDQTAFSHTSLGHLEGEDFHEVAAVTLGDWKYIRRLDTEDTELYNLGSDPGERRNVLSSHPEVAARYAVLLDQILAERPQVEERIDPGLLQKLKAGGYLHDSQK